MKNITKTLLGSVLLLGSLFTGVNGVKAAEYTSITVKTANTFGWAFCDFDFNSIQGARDAIRNGGWQVMNEVPLNYTGHDWAGNKPVQCVGSQVNLVR